MSFLRNFDLRKNIILLSVLFVVLACSTAAIYAWFVSTGEAASQGEVGSIGFELVVDNPSGSRTAAVTSIRDNYVKDFTIENSSNIETFVRISYTPVFRDSEGREALTDSSQITVVSTSLTIDGRPINAITNTTRTASGIEKDFIYPVERANGNDFYYRLQPGENIHGSIIFDVTHDEDFTPDFIISSEMIQATERALQEAADSGWSTRHFRQ
jgi:hypothetical protein